MVDVPLKLKDIAVPRGFIGNGRVDYRPDGVLFGTFNKGEFSRICSAHDYLYSTLSDEDYPEVTKVQADLMLKEEMDRCGFPEHGKAFHQVLQEIGDYYYKKTPQGDPKKTIVFEEAMTNADKTNRIRNRIIDCSLLAGSLFITTLLVLKLSKKT